MHGRGLGLFLLFFSLLAFPSTAWSLEGAPPQLRASLGFGGHVVPSRWQILHIELDRPLPGVVLELRRGRAVGETAAIERWSIGQAMAVDIPVYIDEGARKLAVRLLVDGQVVASREISPLARVFTGHVILASGLTVAEQSALGQILFPREPVLVIPYPAVNLPASFFGLDSVSVLAIREPRLSWSPAQNLAVRQWLASGGRLVAIGRPDQSWLKALFDGPPPAGDFGLGRVALADPALLSLAQPATWRQLVELPDFEVSSRLSPSVGFNRVYDHPAELKPVELSQVFPLAWVLAWLLIMAAACLFRKWLLRAVLIATLLACGAVIVLWQLQPPAWGKGSLVHARALVLPEQTGVLLSENLWFPPAGPGSLAGIQYSPWGLAVTYTRPSEDKSVPIESGRLMPAGDAAAVWTHSSLQAGLLLRGSQDGGWQLNGVQAVNRSLASGAIPGSVLRLRMVDGRLACWRQEAPGGPWIGLEQLPPAFQADGEWIMSLLRIVPGRTWQIGFGQLAGLELDGIPSRQLCWAEVLNREVAQ